MNRQKKAYGITVLRQQSRAVPKRAATVSRALRDLETVFRELFGDEHFFTLLRAESLTMIPVSLDNILHQSEDHDEVA